MEIKPEVGAALYIVRYIHEREELQKEDIEKWITSAKITKVGTKWIHCDNSHKYTIEDLVEQNSLEQAFLTKKEAEEYIEYDILIKKIYYEVSTYFEFWGKKTIPLESLRRIEKILNQSQCCLYCNNAKRVQWGPNDFGIQCKKTGRPIEIPDEQGTDCEHYDKSEKPRFVPHFI